MASFVFTEVVQREVHAQRIDRMNLRTAKAVHASSQPSQAVIADDGRSCGDCEDGADTRDEARRGRCWRRAGNAWPRQAKEKPTGERTVAEEPHATHVFPGHPAKDQPEPVPTGSVSDQEPKNVLIIEFSTQWKRCPFYLFTRD